MATGCTKVPLPDGLPNITSGLISAVGTACAPIRETILVNQPGTAFVGLCTHELDTLVPVLAYAGGNGAITFSDSYSGSGCYTDVVAGIVSAGSAVASAGIESGTCE